MENYDSGAEILGLGSEVGLNTKAASPPVNAYVGVDDVLGISISTSLTGQTLTVFARLLLPDGRIVPNQWTITPAQQRILSTTSIAIPECFILSVTVSTTTFAAQGETFIKIILTRPVSVVQPTTSVLASGYVSNNNTVSWPGGISQKTTDGRGAMRSITGTTPAAGAEISETVPTNALWRLVSVFYQLNTSAAVANRFLTLICDDGANVFFNPLGLITSIPAANNARMTWSAGGPAFNSTGFCATPLPVDLFLPTGFRFRTSTVALQAGDQYTAPQYLVEEWIQG